MHYHRKNKHGVSVETAHCGEGPVIINRIESLAQHVFLSDYKHLKVLCGQAGEQKRGCFEGIYHYTTSQGQIQGCPAKYAFNTTFKDNLRCWPALGSGTKEATGRSRGEGDARRRKNTIWQHRLQGRNLTLSTNRATMDNGHQCNDQGERLRENGTWYLKGQGGLIKQTGIRSLM